MHGVSLGSLGSDESEAFTFSGTLHIGGNAVVSLGDTVGLGNIAFDLDTTSSKTSGLYLVRALKTVGGTPNVHVLGDLTGEGRVTTQKAYYNGNANTPKVFKIQVGSLNQDSTFRRALVNDTSNAGAITKNPLSVKKIGSGTWTLGASATENSLANVDNNIVQLDVVEGTLKLARRANKIVVDNIQVSGGATLSISAADQKIEGNLGIKEGGTLQFDLTGEEFSSLNVGKDLIFDENADLLFLLSSDFVEKFAFSKEINFLNVSGEFGNLEDAIRKAVRNNPDLNNYVTPMVDGGMFKFSLLTNSATVPEASSFTLLLLGALLIRLRFPQRFQRH